MNRLLVMAFALCIAGMAATAPARADILGSLVNSVMEDLLDSLTAEPKDAAKSVTFDVPEEALEGRMSPPRGKLVEIDGRSMRLSPGSKIRDKSNRIVLPGSITAPVSVFYMLDANKQVQSVWIRSSS